MSAVTLLRHATLVVELGGERVLVDPMLDPKGHRPPIDNTPEPRDNPLVDLPANAEGELATITAAVVTHLHEDHLDDPGAALLAERGVPVLGQPDDLATLREKGIADAREIGGRIGELTVTRTGGRHAADPDLAAMLGPVSGVVFEGPEGERVYVAGDTVRVEELDAALEAHAPTVVVLNAGGARFTGTANITLTATDVAEIAAAVPDAFVVAVHMDAINHCLDTRAVLIAELERAGVANVVVPADGERVPLAPPS